VLDLSVIILWENNHAKQFNWTLDNLPIRILRLDADEYLTTYGRAY
jgi:hypothetical protein